MMSWIESWLALKSPVRHSPKTMVLLGAVQDVIDSYVNSLGVDHPRNRV